MRRPKYNEKYGPWTIPLWKVVMHTKFPWKTGLQNHFGGITPVTVKGRRHQYALYFQPRPRSRCWSTRLLRGLSTVKVKNIHGQWSMVNLYRQLEFQRIHTLWATSTVSGLLYYREFMPYCNFFVLTRWNWLAKFSFVDSGRDNRSTRWAGF